MIGVTGGSQVISLELVTERDRVRIRSKRGKEHVLSTHELPAGNRGTRGKAVCTGIEEIELIKSDEGQWE